MLNSLFGNEQSKSLLTTTNLSKKDKCKILKIDFNNKNNSNQSKITSKKNKYFTPKKQTIVRISLTIMLNYVMI